MRVGRLVERAEVLLGALVVAAALGLLWSTRAEGDAPGAAGGPCGCTPINPPCNSPCSGCCAGGPCFTGPPTAPVASEAR